MLPVEYIMGVGNILNSISCSHVMIVSHNVFYSHDVSHQHQPTLDKAFTVYTKFWKKLNRSQFADNMHFPSRRFTMPDFFEYWRPFHRSAKYWKVVSPDVVLSHEMKKTFDIEDFKIFSPFVNSRQRCLFSLVLFSKSA